MKIISAFLDMLKIDSIKDFESKPNTTTIYLPDDSWVQDTEKSITLNGAYDLNRFSKHEYDTIIHVWNAAKRRYPPEYHSVGLVNESSIIKYKPSYILFEMVILLYKDSDNPIDQFAVALAYKAKGAYYRKQSIEYFEKCQEYITTDFMYKFISFRPLSVYISFSTLYEKEHQYEKAIDYMKLAKKYGDPTNKYFDTHIKELEEKIKNPPARRSRKMPESQEEFEKNVTKVATQFLEKLIEASPS